MFTNSLIAKPQNQPQPFLPQPSPLSTETLTKIEEDESFNNLLLATSTTTTPKFASKKIGKIPLTPEDGKRKYKKTPCFKNNAAGRIRNQVKTFLDRVAKVLNLGSVEELNYELVMENSEGLLQRFPYYKQMISYLTKTASKQQFEDLMEFMRIYLKIYKENPKVILNNNT